VLPVIGVIDKGTEVHTVSFREIFEQIEGPDLVSLVGRIGQAMNQIE
jgi:hypothetical protein